MTDEPQRTPGNEEDKPFSFTDKRKVDPTSGAPRVPEETADAGAVGTERV